MLYKIKSVEQIKKNDREWKRVTVEENGMDLQVSAWPDYSLYSQVVAGAEVEGVIVDNKGYKNLKDGNLGQKPASMRSNQIAKAQEHKAEMIAGFQESKERGIKIAGTFNAAWNTAIAEFERKSETTLDALFEKWRKYYWETWGYDDEIPF